jgi:hypothetical protein
MSYAVSIPTLLDLEAACRRAREMGATDDTNVLIGAEPSSSTCFSLENHPKKVSEKIITIYKFGRYQR